MRPWPRHSVFCLRQGRHLPIFSQDLLETDYEPRPHTCWLLKLWLATPRRCLTLSNLVPWQNWMAAYLGYTLRVKTLFCVWPVMVNDTHTRRKRIGCDGTVSQWIGWLCVWWQWWWTELTTVSEQLQMTSAERDHWKSRYDAVHSELNSTRKVLSITNTSSFLPAIRSSKLSGYATSHSGQLSLAIPLWVGAWVA